MSRLPFPSSEKSRRPGFAPEFLLFVAAAASASCAAGGEPSASGEGGGEVPTASSASGPSGVGGAGGAAGAGAGGGSTGGCSPGETKPCYGGPAGTEGVGSCKAGMATCLESGAGFGACEGEVVPAVENCAAPGDENCDGAAASCSGDPLWGKGFGGTGAQYSHGVAVDAAGDLILLVSNHGQVDFGGEVLSTGGDSDVVVAKLDSSGKHLWSRNFAGTGTQIGRMVATDASGNVIVTGRNAGTVDFGGGPFTTAGYEDVFVVKLDPSGKHVWSKSFGTAGMQEGYGIATDTAGNVIVTGGFSGQVDFGSGVLTSAGSEDVFVVKFDPSGKCLWSKAFGGAGIQHGASVATDADGDVIVTGDFANSVDFGGGPLTSGGIGDVFVVKLDPSGEHLWSKGFGGVSSQYGRAVATDADGNVIVTGSNYGQVDFGGGVLTSAGANDLFVAKFDPSGKHVWSRGFGDSADQEGFGVATDSGGNVIVTGTNEGAVDLGGGDLFSHGGEDVFVAKFGSSGNHIWSRTFGDASAQSGARVATDEQGHVLLMGSYQGTFPIGGEPVAMAEDSDVFFAKLAP